MPTGTEERRYLSHNPLDIFDHVHAMQVQLCDALERIADGLPEEVDRRLCAKIASELRYDLPLHFRDEEVGLFPLLRLRSRPEDGIEAVLERLEREHETDRDFAEEVIECVESLGRGQPVANAEMAGYMLRGFFECHRRHVHWETVIVMPFARQRLTSEDLVLLGELMEKNRSQAQ